jgi:hypothetical protein
MTKVQSRYSFIFLEIFIHLLNTRLLFLDYLFYDLIHLYLFSLDQNLLDLICVEGLVRQELAWLYRDIKVELRNVRYVVGTDEPFS